MRVAQLQELLIYPVKSLRGQRVASRALTTCLAGDRQWGVFDTATGKLLSAKTIPALLALAAAHDDASGQVTIFDDTGHRVVAGTPEADEFLSRVVGRTVRVNQGQPEAHAIDVDIDDGEVAHGQVDTFYTKPGWLFDSQSPVHAVSAATLAALGEAHQRHAGAVARYRPNWVLEGCTAFAEEAWIGHTLQVGQARVHVRKRTERCVVPSRMHDAQTPHDRTLLKFLNHQRQFCVGVYLEVVQPGRVQVGDWVTSLGA